MKPKTMKLHERAKAVFETQQAYSRGRISDEQRQAQLSEIFATPVDWGKDPENEGEGEPSNFERDQMEGGWRG